MKIAMTIYYNSDTGELRKVVETKAFKNEGSLLRADVLLDCIGSLEHLYKTGDFSDSIGLCQTYQMRKDYPEKHKRYYKSKKGA